MGHGGVGSDEMVRSRRAFETVTFLSRKNCSHIIRQKPVNQSAVAVTFAFVIKHAFSSACWQNKFLPMLINY